MKISARLLLFIISFLFLASCKDEVEQRNIEQQKELQKREEMFIKVDKNWNFNIVTINAPSQKLVHDWTEWRNFLNEINQKPKSSIGAFQKKARALSKRALELNNNIPEKYAKPEVKSRIAVLQTKINSLDLYINLQTILDKKIIKLIPEINQEIQSLQLQFGEIDQKSQIKMEDGEQDMIRMLDTTRAIPMTKPIPTTEKTTPEEKLRYLREKRNTLIPTH
ncbi:MAG TPA: hypothetical protein PK218_07570 [Flavobacterium sp.]|jgi:hypothetical protein|uniref:hypothetical protein n=1 Tax=Flavobacterium sp. TaxID=239 RepID=UPI002C7B0DB7|nr:hypothetical protein [Flavobacterium sp.]MCA0348326.1 hypothetical protein [Bacteroidota bacterium]HPW98402.1 hypothetical protein [Flavobacterium sp.]HQA73286.1 hypothetical protein [Flavobacterium sp.]